MANPDNYAAALAATSSEFGVNVAAVIMTGRPVNPDHSRNLRKLILLPVKPFVTTTRFE